MSALVKSELCKTMQPVPSPFWGGLAWGEAKEKGADKNPRLFRLQTNRVDQKTRGRSLRSTCRPHSVLSWPAQRPARGLFGSSAGCVHGQHPIEG